MRVVRHQKRLPSEDVPSPEVLKARLGGPLSNLIQWKVSWSIEGDCNEMIFGVPSKPNHSMILWFREKVLRMRSTWVFLHNEIQTQRILWVLIKTQKPTNLLCGFEDSGVASIQDHPEKETQSRLVIATPCLDSSIPLPIALKKLYQSAGGGSLWGRRWTSCRSAQHNTSPICCNSLELPNASGDLFLMISPWVSIKLWC